MPGLIGLWSFMLWCTVAALAVTFTQVVKIDRNVSIIRREGWELCPEGFCCCVPYHLGEPMALGLWWECQVRPIQWRENHTPLGVASLWWWWIFLLDLKLCGGAFIYIHLYTDHTDVKGPINVKALYPLPILRNNLISTFEAPVCPFQISFLSAPQEITISSLSSS